MRRNPWSENESGFYYVRSMASYAVLNALNGFEVDNVKKTMKFAPQMKADNYKAFWCSGKAWGTYSQKKQPDGSLERKLDVLYGSIEGIKIIYE